MQEALSNYVLILLGLVVLSIFGFGLWEMARMVLQAFAKILAPVADFTRNWLQVSCTLQEQNSPEGPAMDEVEEGQIFTVRKGVLTPITKLRAPRVRSPSRTPAEIASNIKKIAAEQVEDQLQQVLERCDKLTDAARVQEARADRAEAALNDERKVTRQHQEAYDGMRKELLQVNAALAERSGDSSLAVDSDQYEILEAVALDVCRDMIIHTLNLAECEIDDDWVAARVDEAKMKIRKHTKAKSIASGMKRRERDKQKRKREADDLNCWFANESREE